MTYHYGASTVLECNPIAHQPPVHPWVRVVVEYREPPRP
eukprot:IDg19035t1